MQDLQVAANAAFPLQADTYQLNWNSIAYDNGPKFFNPFAVTQRLWIGGSAGSVRETGYRFYSGDFPLKQYYERLQAGAAVGCGPITGIYMLEKADLVPAYAISLGNGEFMAFADGQVIAKSEHAGADVYEVYAVKGISLPPSTT